MENTDVLEAIELVLKKSATPVSYKLVVISTRAHLRKVFLNSGVDHLTNKTEFEKHWFKKALESEDGKQKIRLLEKNTKVGLKGWHSQIPISNKPADGISIKEATDYMEVFIKHLHHTKLEELVSCVIENRYGYVKDKTHPAYKLTGDSGLDFYGVKNDPDDHKRQQVFLAQVKQQKANIDRSLAQNLHGAVNEALMGKQFTKVMALFVTSGSFSQGFLELISRYSTPGITYICWDGQTLAQKIVGTGIGFKFHLDKDYWADLDPDIFDHIAKSTEQDKI